MLAHLLQRLQRSQFLDRIVVGTGPGPENEPIRSVVKSLGYHCPVVTREEDDVLGRFVDIATSYGAHVIVRITGDCPLIDPAVVDKVISALTDTEYIRIESGINGIGIPEGYKPPPPTYRADFASNVVRRTYPRGLDTEVFTIQTLMRLDRLLPSWSWYREHVCNFVYSHPWHFNMVSVEDSIDRSEEVWCVDTPEDLRRVEEMCSRSS